MKGLTPLVRLGRLRFQPTTKVLEGPEQVHLVSSSDAFASMVPDSLRPWFYDRANIRKVVIDDQNRRLVLTKEPDKSTDAIQIEFGQLGAVSTYDHMYLTEIGEDRAVAMKRQPPDDESEMSTWLTQSVNRAAGDFFRDVIADLRAAFQLGCSYVTSCEVTIQLLNTLDSSSVGKDAAARSALTLRLPTLEAASIEQIAVLIEREQKAFEALQFELRATAQRLALINDPADLQAELKRAEQELARDQVNNVERKLQATRRELAWDIPITAAHLAAGALGLVTANPALGILSAGLLSGGAKAAASAKKQFEHKLLPGYFLWKLEKS